ncbi:SID1 transmembrane family member 1 [Trichonephila clavipes]|nr:SID1 transmembrane family member 1 [Trichonephila clavipes]
MQEFVCTDFEKEDTGHLKIGNGLCDRMNQVTSYFALIEDVEFEVCRTLCPIANYKDSRLKPGKQNISIEISTSSNTNIDLFFQLSREMDFVITKDAVVNVSITPAMPWVMQYNMEDSLRAVRIEATSPDQSCMVLAIQGIQCPIYDSVELVEPRGYYQTLIRQSGISIGVSQLFTSRYTRWTDVYPAPGFVQGLQGFVPIKHTGHDQEKGGTADVSCTLIGPPLLKSRPPLQAQVSKTMNIRVPDRGLKAAGAA